jgi:hypothetical protein
LADDLVLHIGDVHHVVDPKSSEFKVTPEEIGKIEGPEISDVTEVVHRRPAAVETDGLCVREEWGEFFHATVERVEQAQGHAMNR